MRQFETTDSSRGRGGVQTPIIVIKKKLHFIWCCTPCGPTFDRMSNNVLRAPCSLITFSGCLLLVTCNMYNLVSCVERATVFLLVLFRDEFLRVLQPSTGWSHTSATSLTENREQTSGGAFQFCRKGLLGGTTDLALQPAKRYHGEGVL